MVVAIYTWRIKKGQEASSEEIIRRYIAKVDSEPGTLTYAVYRRKDDPSSYLIVERYRDEAADKAHGEAPYRKDLDLLMPMFDGELKELGRFEQVAAIGDKD